MKDNGEIDALANYVGLRDDSALHILDDHGLLDRQKVRGIAIAHYYGKEKMRGKGSEEAVYCVSAKFNCSRRTVYRAVKNFRR